MRLFLTFVLTFYCFLENIQAQNLYNIQFKDNKGYTYDALFYQFVENGGKVRIISKQESASNCEIVEYTFKRGGNNYSSKYSEELQLKGFNVILENPSCISSEKGIQFNSLSIPIILDREIFLNEVKRVSNNDFVVDMMKISVNNQRYNAIYDQSTEIGTIIASNSIPFQKIENTYLSQFNWKKKGEILINTQTTTIAKPIITWVNPRQEEIISTTSNQTLKACISSATRPSQIQLLINGRPYSTKDFIIEPANKTNCDYSYELSVNITTKNEPLNFILAVTNEGGTSQSARKITIKEQRISENLPKVYAVIVGIADYQGEANDLKYCADDAKKVYNFLRSPNGGSIPESQIKYFVNGSATNERVLQATNELFGKAKPNDQIMFYFSGHGGVGYFCGYDDNIQHEAVRNIFMNSQAQRKICIADACHSGSWEKARKELAIKSRELSSEEMTQLYYNTLTNSGIGLALFMSCQENETSIDHPVLKQGLFTYYYLEGLKGGADLNFDKIITIQELYDYTKTRVSKSAQNDFRSSQTPKLKGTFDHDTPIGVIK